MPGSERVITLNRQSRTYVVFTEWANQVRPGDMCPRGKFFRGYGTPAYFARLARIESAPAALQELAPEVSEDPVEAPTSFEQTATLDQLKVALEPMPNYRSSGFASTWNPS